MRVALWEPCGSFRVALGSHWYRIGVALGWLWWALTGISAFCILPSAFAAVWLGVAVPGDCKWPMANGQLRGLSPPISTFCFVPLPEGAFEWFCPAFQGSKFEVQGSRFRVRHKHPEYKSPLPPPSGWSGGGLVPPWTCPGTIDPPQDPIFDQAGLSKSVACGSSTVQRRPGLEVGSWIRAASGIYRLIQSQPLLPQLSTLNHQLLGGASPPGPGPAA
jgi:hypothetical protein